MALVTAAQWASFNAEGYLRLGTVATPAMLASLQQRIDEIMLGTAPVDYKRMLMQLDSADGAYESAGVQNKGFKGETLNYRKIEQLEEDPIFLAYMQLPIFAEIARHIYGDVPISAFRAMFMNKPAHRGTHLPLHQDHWRALDRNPLITIYTALDAADETNGCVELIPGTHHKVLNPRHPSGFLTAEMAAGFADDPRRMPLVLAAGEVALLHNWTLHASGINPSNRRRRAFSVCLMEAATMSLRFNRPAVKNIIFGAGARTPDRQGSQAHRDSLQAPPG